MSTKSLVITGVILSLVGITLGVAGVSLAWSDRNISPLWPMLISVAVLLMAVIVHRRRISEQSE